MGWIPRRLKQLFRAASASGVVLIGGCVTPGGLQGRPLTQNERDTARSIFGDTIDYDKVKVYNGAPKVAGIFTLNQNKLSAITPNGDIYLVGKYNQQPDLTLAGEATRKLLIHEMAHVWQHQQGRNVQAEAVFLFIKSGFDYDSSYAYDINGKEKFLSLNLEQQAHMIEDYFALRNDTQSTDPDRAAKIAKFEAMLKPCLPITHSAATQPPKQAGKENRAP